MDELLALVAVVSADSGGVDVGGAVRADEGRPSGVGDPPNVPLEDGGLGELVAVVQGPRLEPRHEQRSWQWLQHAGNVKSRKAAQRLLDQEQRRSQQRRSHRNIGCQCYLHVGCRSPARTTKKVSQEMLIAWLFDGVVEEGCTRGRGEELARQHKAVFADIVDGHHELTRGRAGSSTHA